MEGNASELICFEGGRLESGLQHHSEAFAIFTSMEQSDGLGKCTCTTRIRLCRSSSHSVGQRWFARDMRFAATARHHGLSGLYLVHRPRLYNQNGSKPNRGSHFNTFVSLHRHRHHSRHVVLSLFRMRSGLRLNAWPAIEAWPQPQRHDSYPATAPHRHSLNGIEVTVTARRKSVVLNFSYCSQR